MMRWKIVSSLMVLALAAALISGATFAWFTSQATNANNLFQAGTLTINVSDPTDGGAAFNVGNMAPGDVVSGTLVLENTGSLPCKVRARVVGDASGEANLANVLEVNFNNQGWQPLTSVLNTWFLVENGNAIASGATVSLPAQVRMMASAGNEYQNQTWSGDIEFEAIQDNASF